MQTPLQDERIPAKAWMCETLKVMPCAESIVGLCVGALDYSEMARLLRG